MATPVSSTIDPARMDQLETVWKDVRETVIQYGSITKAGGSLASVKDLTTRLGIDSQQPNWTNALEDILRQASSNDKPSVRVAAAGIARSFRILGMWGELLTTDVKDKEACLKARLVAGRVLRSLSRNPFMKFGDWLQEKIISRLLNAGCLPTGLIESYNRIYTDKGRESDDFDAVQEFTVAGMRDECAAVKEKVDAMKIGRFSAFLLKIENFLADVIGPSLSKIDAVANLQVRWRLVVARMDLLLLKMDAFTERDTKIFQGYVSQFKWMRKSLSKYAKEGFWKLGDDAVPFLHLKRIQLDSIEKTATLVQRRLAEFKLIEESTVFVFVECS
jgi:hypothetical protein